MVNYSSPQEDEKRRKRKEDKGKQRQETIEKKIDGKIKEIKESSGEKNRKKEERGN